MVPDPKADLYEYLRSAREVMLWKLDGLSEFAIRRTLVPTGTNLLGLVQHSATTETGYLGSVFGRPFDEPPSWMNDGEPNGDMWVRSSQSKDQIVDFCRRVWAHSDATIDALPLDATGEVPWWPDGRRQITLHRALVHVITDIYRHAGHADILRELIDGSVGVDPRSSNLPPRDASWWTDYRAKVELNAVDRAVDGIEVRTAIPADAEAVEDYHDRCFRDTYAVQIFAGEFEAPNRAGMRKQLHDWLQPDSGFETLVAVIDGAPIAHVTTQDNQLVHLFVEPGRQRAGLGRYLLARGEARLAAGGHLEFELPTRVENLPAIAFYESAGWTMTDQMIRTVEHGIAYDEHLLVKHRP